MKKELNISATLDQPALLEDLVERLACRRYDIGFCREKMPVSLEALETSSTETYVSGTVSFDDDGGIDNIPFIINFLFTCIKTNNDPYRLTWSTSLS